MFVALTVETISSQQVAGRTATDRTGGTIIGVDALGAVIVNAEGGSGNDTLIGNNAANVLTGGEGDDVLVGRDGNDTLEGGRGNDILQGDGGDDTLRGGDGNDILSGGRGNDVLEGGAGDDSLIVSADIDDAAAFGPRNFTLGNGDILPVSLAGRSGEGDRLSGGTGIDTVIFTPASPDKGFVFDRANSSLDLSGVEKFIGTDGDDIILLPKNYTTTEIGQIEIDGGLGNDILQGSDAQADKITGGTGNDLISGLGGNDDLDGGADNDQIWGGAGNDTIRGGEGNDVIYGNAGSDQLSGGSGDDTFHLDGDVIGSGSRTVKLDNGTTRTISVVGLAGTADVVTGGANFDRIVLDRGGRDGYLHDTFSAPNYMTGVEAIEGTSGRDVILVDENYMSDASGGGIAISGGAGDDVLTGGRGSDLIEGGANNDLISGLAGNDTLLGGDGDDEIWGGDGDDTIRGGDNNDELFGNAGNDTVYGDDGDDVLTGGAGINSLFGGSGNDILGGDSIRQTTAFDGGSGVDMLHVKSPGSKVTVNLATGTITGGHYDGSTVAGIENVKNESPNYAVEFIGNDVDNLLIGGNMNDVLVGGRGNDTLRGGAGNDTIRHNAGDGDDIVDGGTETGTTYPDYDELVINGDATARTFTLGLASVGPEIGNSASKDILVSYDGGSVRADEIERVTFNLGSSGDTTVLNPVTDSAIRPTTIVVNGGAGNDTIDLSNFVGSTVQIVDASGTDADTLKLSNVRWQDVTVTQENGQFILNLPNGTIVKAGGIESFTFQNGTVTAQQLIQQDPSDIDTTGLTIAENAGEGALVGSVSATDVNGPIDPLTYAFVTNSGISQTSPDGRFTINATTGAISVVAGAVINYETEKTIDVIIRVTDSGRGFVEETFTINVTDVNEAPTAVGFTNVMSAIDENIVVGPNGIKVADITVTDDALGTNQLSLVGDDAASFRIVGNELYFIGTQVNYEAKASYSVSVQVNDPTVGGTPDASQTFTLAVNNRNDLPTSNDDSITILEDTATPLTINDFGTFTDEDGTSLAAVKITALPLNGTLQFQGTSGWTNVSLDQEVSVNDIIAGKLQFVPASNANGANYATIGFQVGDGVGFSAQSYSLNVNVTPENDPPTTNAVTASGNEDTLIAITLSGSDIDGTVANYRINTLPSNGELYGDAAMTQILWYNSQTTGATVYFKPYPNFNGQVTFSYSAIDNTGAVSTSPATATITVAPANDNPGANNDVLHFGGDTAPAGTGWVLNEANGHYYKFVRADGVSWADAVSGAANQAPGAYLLTLTNAAEQNFVMTNTSMGLRGQMLWLGASDAQTEGTFKWVTGPEAGSVVASYLPWGPGEPNNWDGDEDYVLVNRWTGPSANTPVWNDAASTADNIQGYVAEWSGNNGSITEDTVQRFSTSLLTANDGDLDGDAITLISVSNSTRGAIVTLNNDGTITYDPSQSTQLQQLAQGQTLVDTFTYTIRDVHNATSTATASITIRGVNDAPVVSAVVEGTATEGGVTSTLNALANASDPEGSALSVVNIGTLPAGVTYNATNKTFTLDPTNSAYASLAAGATTTVAVSYQVSDGSAATSAQVSWTVTGIANNAAPTAVGETIITNSITTVIPDWVLLLNDNDTNVGDVLSVNADPNSPPNSYGWDDEVSDTGTTTTYVDWSAYNWNPELGGSFKYTVSDGNGGVSSAVTTTVVYGSSLNGTSSSEILIGSGNLNGNGGNDVLVGGSGDDKLSGGAGNDILFGGSGADLFKLSTISGTDTIKDFRVGTDKIGLLDNGSASNANNGSVNFGSTNSGSTLNGGDVKTSASMAWGNNNSFDNKVVVITGEQTEAQIKASIGGVSGNDHADNTYVVVYNSDQERAEIWFDSNWNTTTGRTLVAVLENVTAAQVAGLDRYSFAAYNDVTDPIILDLDKNGFAFSSIDSGVNFDINADGQKDQIAWTSDDGILAYDVDGNGTIDNGSEIFTPDFNGGKFASGVAALASLDSNGDGKIDAGDAAFKDLKIWVDADNDGVSDDGELSSLTDNGVTSISLTTDQSGGSEDGQVIFAEGEFTFADGSTGNFVEVGFDTIFGSEPEGVTLHGGLGEVLMTGTAGADTFVFDATALDDIDVADVITDFSTAEGDVLDVTALLDSLLGEQPDATVDTLLRATLDGAGNTTVSVQAEPGIWKDVVELQNHDTAIKVLFEDKHTTIIPHD